jgi:hypothetical protein
MVAEKVLIILIVHQILGPSSPILTIDSSYHPSVVPRLTATIASQPLWQGYEIMEFRVDVINGSDDSLLYNLTVPNNSSRNNTANIIINETLLESTTEQCYSIKVSASAVSSLYGLSEPTVVEAAVFRGRLVCLLMGMKRLNGHHQRCILCTLSSVFG